MNISARGMAVSLGVVVGAGAAIAAQQTPPVTEFVQQSRAAAKALGTQLKQELQGAMQAGGPVRAVTVCSERAPQIAAAVSTERMTVGRTALRVRNPQNAPDPWERQVLEAFAAELQSGTAAQSLERHAWRKTEAGRVFRYMKAIPTGGLCVTCHGDDLAPEIAAAIDARYPEDEARGFAVGDLRGAFTVTIRPR